MNPLTPSPKPLATPPTIKSKPVGTSYLSILTQLQAAMKSANVDDWNLLDMRWKCLKENDSNVPQELKELFDDLYDKNVVNFMKKCESQSDRINTLYSQYKISPNVVCNLLTRFDDTSDN